MSRIRLAWLSLTLITVGPASAALAESASISLSVPANLAATACAVPVWKGTEFRWEGVADARPSPEVGLQTQKGEEPIPILAAPPLDRAFDQALQSLFSSCGMKLDGGGIEGIPTLSAEIREFSAGVDKKLLTGKSQAKSSIAFTSRRGGRSQTVTVGYEIDTKKIRSGSTKQLEKALNELFAETLRQIPATPEMRDL